MRRTARLLLFCGLLALLAACGSGSNSDEPDWESISSTPGRFSADFPVEPKRQTQRVPATGEPLELVAYTAETANEALSVSYVDYRAPATGEEAKKVLDAAVEGVSSALQGQNLTKKPGTFLAHEAVDYTVDVDNQTVVGKAFLVDARMYVLQLARAKTAGSGSFDRLIKSFKLIPGDPATPTASPTLDIAIPGAPSATAAPVAPAAPTAPAAAPSAAPSPTRPPAPAATPTSTVLPPPVPSP